MRLLLILYIALGLVLSLAIGIEYNCTGPEVFPRYFGSPFVFKQSSLGSSMEYHYSISGLVLNLLLWSALLFFIDKGIKRIIKSRGSKIGYKVLILLLVVFSTLNLAKESVMISGKFSWYTNIDKEAKEWGMNCEGEFIMFKF